MAHCIVLPYKNKTLLERPPKHEIYPNSRRGFLKQLLESHLLRKHHQQSHRTFCNILEFYLDNVAYTEGALDNHESVP